MSEAKKYDRSYKEQSVKLALEVGVKRASDEQWEVSAWRVIISRF